MNHNAIIATLELKGIITRAEGEKLVEHLNNVPQSTSLNDAVEQVKALFNTKPEPKKVAESSDNVKKDTDKTIKK
jgi:hypothetical protein